MPEPMHSPATPSARWRVLTWNILGREQRLLQPVADHIRTERADVVGLQEVRRGQARTIARQLGWRHEWRVKHWTYGPLWWLAEGHAVLTPHRLSTVRRHLLTAHERPWVYRRRIALAATVQRTDGAQIRLYCTHLASDSPDARIEQARRLAGIVRSDAHPMAVVCGDLNAPDEVEVLREFATAGLIDHGSDPTNPANSPMQRLDYILVPRAAIEVDIETPEPGDEWRVLSDHLPVLGVFSVNA